MTDVIIKPTSMFKGEIAAPSSKSYTHRMLVASLLSDGKSIIEKPLVSDDTLATLEAVKALGAQVKQNDVFWEIDGQRRPKAPESLVDCRESATTLRFMIPVAALAHGNTTFLMGQSLSRRPIAPLIRSLKQLGVKTQYKPPLIMVYGKGIEGGKTTLRGDISSQFVSGLLFACPLAKSSTEITLTEPVESKSYIEMTAEVLSKHAIKVRLSEDNSYIHIQGGQNYQPFTHKVPGDFSSAAYILAAAAITSSKVRIYNLDCASKQGDKAILEILKRSGVSVSIGEDFVEVEGSLSKSMDIDACDIPDLVPACTAIACYTTGTSIIRNAERLRYKESNRLKAIYTEFRKMGADIDVKGDGLLIRGPCRLHGAVINPHGDHRIAMACTAAALGAEGDTAIINAECVRKSYPKFFEDLHMLGANIVGKLDW